MDVVSQLYIEDVKEIVVPSSGVFVFPFGEMSREERELRDPRGICTDREGNFWVADRGSDRVLCLRYSPEEKRFLYRGCITGVKFGECSGLRQTEWTT